MPAVSSCIASFAGSAIRDMTLVADSCGAINLSQGYPDFAPPRAITDKLAEVAVAGPHQYEITYGSELFRRTLAEKQSRLMGLAINPDKHLVVTCGATEAMLTIMLALCEAGDKVVIFSPHYENYGADAILAGAEPIYMPLNPPTFDFNRAELEAIFAQGGVKAIVICNPNNPCGKVFTADELVFIASLAIKYDAFVITDEVYDHIVYKPHKHVYMSALPNMFERTICCNSLSKTYSITGWRLGYILGGGEALEACRKVHDFVTVGAAAPLQRAAAEGLMFADSYYEQLLEMYDNKRKLFLGGLKDIGFQFYEPQGAFYVLVNIAAINKYKTDFEFCKWLAREVGVAGVPGSAFFHEPNNDYVRFHWAKADDTLNAALEKLDAVRKLINK